MLLLVEGVRERRDRRRGRAQRWPRCPHWPHRRWTTHAAQLAGRYRFAGRVVTTGRGYAYPTAREAALKLMETSYLAALAFSGADLLHGPLAMADPDVPVLAVVGSGPGGAAMQGRAGPARRAPGRRGDDRRRARSGRDRCGCRTPEVDERFAALLDILPLQQLALAARTGPRRGPGRAPRSQEGHRNPVDR